MVIMRHIQCVFIAVFIWMLSTTASFAQPPENFVPLPMNWNEVPNAVFDLSGYLDAPAGKDGYIRVEGEHLYKPDGSRFRPWGVNMNAGFFFMPKDKAEKVAADFARFGFTCVRFHSLDASQRGFLFPNPNNTIEWDAQRLDQFDYFVAQLKKYGIHFTITLNVFRVFREDDGVVDYDKMGYGKPTYYFNEKIQERGIEFSRRLLTHKNPYTGVEYRHEPALAWIELLNENSLIEAWLVGRLEGEDNSSASTAWTPLTSYYAKELRGIWNSWLEKNATVAQRREWAKTLDAQVSDIPLSSPKNRNRLSDDHYHAEVRFLMEMEEKYFMKMKTFLRDEMGTKTLLVGSSHHSTTTSPYPHTLAFSRHGDFITGQGYWLHPQFGSPVVESGLMANDPFNSVIPHFARTPMKGMPFVITETNSPFPQRYAGEFIPVLAAYSLLHDWDGILWFQWGNGQFTASSEPANRFAQGNDPVKFANMILTGYVFHRKDIDPARQTVVRTVSRKDALESLRFDRSEKPFFTKGFPKLAAIQHRTQWQLAEEGQQTFPSAPPLDLICSDTEQLVWKNADRKKGVITINTPLTQGAIGLLGGYTEKLGDIDILVKNEYATVILTSLDGKPIQTAERLLLLTHTFYMSTGLDMGDDGQTLKDLGTHPMRILPVEGTIILKNIGAAKKITVTPLTAIGAPTGKSYDALDGRGCWTVSLIKEVATWYQIEVIR